MQYDNQVQNQNQTQNSLFAQTLHPISSKYIQTKFNMNGEDQEKLENLDLRTMCENVKDELNQIEQTAAYDYLKVEKEMDDLDTEITQSDQILGELEDVLMNFRDHLDDIKSQMTSLQERSLKMNTSLTNRKHLLKLLGTFMDSAVLDPKLIEAINQNNIDEEYVQHIKTLCQKLEYLKNSQLSDATAVRDLEPQLNKLKNKACGRVRTFLLEKIALLKQPKTNVYILQKNYLVKYRILTEFLKEHYLEIYVEICKNYAEILSKFYLTSFKAYCKEIDKLYQELYNKNDLTINDNFNYMRQQPNSKGIDLNQQGRSIFYLMDREKILKSEKEDLVQQYIQGSLDKSKKYTLERVFKNINTRLIDCVKGEVLFTSEFFNLNPQQNEQIFGGIFRQTFNYLFDFFKDKFQSSYDLYAQLLSILINEQNRNDHLQDNRFIVLQYYYGQIGQIIWPRFETLFDNQLLAVRNSNIKLLKDNEKRLGWKFIYSRLADFLGGLYSLYSQFDDNRMLSIRITSFRDNLMKLMQRSANEIQREFDKITYLLKIQDLLIQTYNQSHLKQPKKEFNEDLLLIEKETNKLIEQFTGIYMKDLFSNLIEYVKANCKQDLGEEGNLGSSHHIEQKPQDNVKLVENICQDLSYSWNKRTEAFKSETEKLFQGMPVCKKILKKFLNTFMTYYGSFYKHLKQNYPSHSNQLIKVHEIMKEISKNYEI
ncbi:hypothetical protein PPERSA_01512 [Pseudocohnilembus persalinus]|uniref:Vps52/Sac2 n=1 Tax=Pseudocohnilembus persalinus TaxID=266149 RepID=A0A0V0R7N2_PSEPJ|nr:hypothetical protein PPERSA_01512 [Pseudocohnilembus persalinus]|eukprot:KRX10500.1 hypothetical protein PPERSA_01512 [Pseudocohnilembus persalinus]